MPLGNVEFKDGIMYCTEAGRIDITDARKFERALMRYANISPIPIVVFIDARSVETITQEAIQAFTRTALIPNVKVNVVVTYESIIQTVRHIGLKNRKKNTIIFDDWREAHDYALSQIDQSASTG